MDTVALRRALGLLDPAHLRARPFRCPACGPSLLLQLAREETAVRCLRCRASAVTLSILTSLARYRLVTASTRAYETSSRGPLHAFLQRHCALLRCSEYMGGVARGEMVDGVQCQDLHALSFADASFDLVTVSEVFEHVADDHLAFTEVRRVLRPGGTLLLTVPLDLRATSIERACPNADGIEYLLPPAFHGDRIRGDRGVLVYRDYGCDLPARLRAAGFRRVHVDLSTRTRWYGFGRPVVLAW